MAEMRSVELLTNIGCTKSEEFGGLRPNEFLSLSHVPRRLAGHADVDVHPVLGGLALGHPKKADGWTDTVRVDDGSTVGVVARLNDIPERGRPERGDSMRIGRITTECPMRCQNCSVRWRRSSKRKPVGWRPLRGGRRGGLGFGVLELCRQQRSLFASLLG